LLPALFLRFGHLFSYTKMTKLPRRYNICHNIQYAVRRMSHFQTSAPFWKQQTSSFTSMPYGNASSKKNRLRDQTGFGMRNSQDVEKNVFKQSVCTSVCLYVYQFVCLSVCLSVLLSRVLLKRLTDRVQNLIAFMSSYMKRYPENLITIEQSLLKFFLAITKVRLLPLSYKRI